MPKTRIVVHNKLVPGKARDAAPPHRVGVGNWIARREGDEWFVEVTYPTGNRETWRFEKSDAATAAEAIALAKSSQDANDSEVSEWLRSFARTLAS